MSEEASQPMSEEVAELRCSHCAQPILPGGGVVCQCEKYGYYADADKVYCNYECLEQEHLNE